MINLFYSRYHAQKLAEYMGLSKYVVAGVHGIKRYYYRIYIPCEDLQASSRYLAAREAESRGLSDTIIKREENEDKVFYQVYTPFPCTDVIGGNNHD